MPASSACEGHYAFLPPDGKEALDGNRALTSKASLAHRFLVLSGKKKSGYFPLNKSTTSIICIQRGWTGSRLSKYYVRPWWGAAGGSNESGLNVELGFCDSTRDNKAVRSYSQTDWRWMLRLRGGLPKHDDNTVYRDEKEAGREEKLENKPLSAPFHPLD
ncbi:Hypothetical predicted protein [Scomber scombrus]|uniref:Uncharacterized protein n=1 Tax=Scomber scombrus TaxID=13677 RepID=A0AAV1PC40_SCOSC